jgi:hypothetical protein
LDFCASLDGSPIPQFHHIYTVKVFLEFYLLLEEVHRRIFYIKGGVSLQKLGRRRVIKLVPGTQSNTALLVEAR